MLAKLFKGSRVNSAFNFQFCLLRGFLYSLVTWLTVSLVVFEGSLQPRWREFFRKELRKSFHVSFHSKQKCRTLAILCLHGCWCLDMGRRSTPGLKSITFLLFVCGGSWLGLYHYICLVGHLKFTWLAFILHFLSSLYTKTHTKHKTHTLGRCLFVCVGVVGWMVLTNIQPTVTSLRHSGHVTGCVKGEHLHTADW